MEELPATVRTGNGHHIPVTGRCACVTVMHNFDHGLSIPNGYRNTWVLRLKNRICPNGAPWQPGCGGGVAWGAAVILCHGNILCIMAISSMLKVHL